MRLAYKILGDRANKTGFKFKEGNVSVSGEKQQNLYACLLSTRKSIDPRRDGSQFEARAL